MLKLSKIFILSSKYFFIETKGVLNIYCLLLHFFVQMYPNSAAELGSIHMLGCSPALCETGQNTGVCDRVQLLENSFCTCTWTEI